MKPITLRILCEGYSEQNFITQILGPHLSIRQIYAKAEPLYKGNFGVISYEKLRHAIKADVGRSRAHEYVTTMVDLYKLGRYPGSKAKHGESPYDRVARIEQEMGEGLPNPRFIPYVQLYEFEALVLVDVEKIPVPFPDGEAREAPAKLKKSLGAKLEEPELVNDGVSTAPSKRIIQVVPEYQYRKSVAGPAIVGAIGLETLRTKCPHFHHWVSLLERLSDD